MRPCCGRVLPANGGDQRFKGVSQVHRSGAGQVFQP
jgi:hypothetical protein